MHPPAGPSDRPGVTEVSGSWGSAPQDPQPSASPYPQGSPYPPATPYPSGSPTGSTGTPLGRIVLGTFLGASLALLVWGAVAFVAGIVLAASLVSTVRDSVEDFASDPSSTSVPAEPSLSEGCRRALDSVDADEFDDACTGDDQQEVLRYLSERLERLQN